MHGAAGGGRRIPSARRKVLGAAIGLAGTVAGFFAFAVILQIDQTATALHMSTAQDAVGVSAVTAGLAGIGGSLACAVRWWRRPAAEITPAGVLVRNWRPVLVPWPVIRAVTAAQPDTGARVPALLLADGEVLPLRFARPVPEEHLLAAGGPDKAETAAIQMIRAALHAQQPDRPADQVAGLPAARGAVRGTLARRQLPGTPVTTLPRGRLPGQWLTLLVVPLFVLVPRLVAAQHGHPFDVAQFLLAIGAVAGALGLVVAAQWSHSTRRVVIGQDWLAWQPRIHLGWHALPLAQVISIAPETGLGGRLVALRRADGRGIRLSAAELRTGAAGALLPVLDGHPGFTAAARSMMAQAAGVSLPAATHPDPAGAPRTAPGGDRWQAAGWVTGTHQGDPGAVPGEAAEPSLPYAARTSVTHRAAFGWFALLAGSASQLTFMLLLILLPNPASTDGFGPAFANRLAGAAVGTLFVLFLCHLGRCRVTATRSGIVIQQPLMRYVLPWAQVETISVGPDGGLLVRSRDLGVIRVVAFSGSLIGALTGGVRARRACDEITEVQSSARAGQQEATGRSAKSVSISWLIPALAGLTLVLAALIGALVH